MRHTLACVVCLLVGCHRNAELSSAPGEDDGAGGGAPGAGLSACLEDRDCVAAAATCCDCPEFAVNVGDPAHRACTGVTCPGQRGCEPNVRAACDQGDCVLACVELACPVSCPSGYAIDPTGCLSCTCAAPEPGGCAADADCVQTRADCCGCAQGGQDTAVVASERASYDAMLGCPAAPACPAVDVCEPEAAPRCVQGRCELTSGLPPGACGRADLPACPAGAVCTVNASDAASMQGVGVCVNP